MNLIFWRLQQMSRFELNEVKIKSRLKSQTKQARRLLKNEIAKDTERFVPMQGGYLKNSIIHSLQSDDDYIIYNTPYARFLYYGFVMIGKITHRPWAKRGETKIKTDRKLNYGKVHPLACSHWFERSKALYKKNWLKITKKVYKNG